MITGKRIFICDDCGKVFIAPSAEWRCSALTAPARCPRCGSRHTYTGIFQKHIYKKIWYDADRWESE